MPDSHPPADLDLRLVRYFTVVADHRHFGHAALTTVPLEGVDPVHVVLATRANDRGRLVAAFRKCAQAHLAGSSPGMSP